MSAPTMRALWLEGGSVQLRDDLPVPDPPSGEVLVRVLQAGICGTDLELRRGYFPFVGVPGHEFVGRVEEASGRLAGRRVVGEINASCGDCDSCRGGRRNHCPSRTVLGIVSRNGAFAEYLTLPSENLHPLPDGLDDDAAVFAEPLAAALRIGEQLSLGPADRVVVVGDGKLGQLIARALQLSGCRLLVAGRHPSKLRLLEDAGVTTTAGAPEPASHDVAVECTGDPSGFAAARRALRPGGTLVLKSTYAGRLDLDASALVVDEITLLGSRCGPFEPALSLLEDGRIDPRPLIQARYPLSRAPEALERAAQPGTLKVILDMASWEGAR